MDSLTHDRQQVVYIGMLSESSKLDWILQASISESLSSNDYWQLLYYPCLTDRFKRSLRYDAIRDEDPFKSGRAISMFNC